ncbi:threonylcarbamoyl-AMP synthase [Candidatus Daviesbacteria bacterium]|nr:threonylcarbamoyl-AMP synthase [Candidatus Daviesbacteria bacterium]
MEFSQIVRFLKEGKIGVIPTDTIYGLIGSAFNPHTVEEIYKLRKRVKDKPMIILISSIDDLKKFDIKLTDIQRDFLKKNWPNPLSVVLSCKVQRFSYLHRGTNTLAFRMPKDTKLLNILREAGPVVAPSANLEGKKHATNINQARKYFGDKVSFYLDGGYRESKPSTIVAFDNNLVKILRRGIFKI